MFFTLAQPGTSKYAYDHNVRTHATRKEDYRQGSVFACSTGASLCQRYLSVLVWNLTKELQF